MSIRWPPEFRLNSDGTVDEIVLYDDAGEVVFNLEQMTQSHYWMAFYPPGYGPDSKIDEVRAWIGSVSGRAAVRCTVPDGVPEQG